MPAEPKSTDEVMVGDQSFSGLNQFFDDPSKLAPGEVWDAVNTRFTTGAAEPRLGVAKLPWTNRAVASVDGLQPLGEVYGAGEFRDNDGVNWLIVAAAGKVFRTRENSSALEIPLPPGVTISSDVDLTQTFNGLVMSRGKNLPRLYLKTFDEGFKAIAMEPNNPDMSAFNTNNGTQPLPPGDNGDWAGNRFFFPFETATEKDLMGISDYGNATVYWPANVARINQGSSDKLLRFFQFTDQVGICFKTESVHALIGIRNDLTQMSLNSLTDNFGLAGPRAVALIGGNESQTPNQVWFLARNLGIMAIQMGTFGKLGVTQIPLSAPVKRIIARIDWRNANKSCFAYLDNKLYAALPLDNSESPGPELTGHRYFYDGSGLVTFSVLPGQRYRWAKGNDSSLANFTETLTESGYFTAQLGVVVFHGPAGQAATGSLYRIFQDTCNAVLVYDFVRGKWAGLDTGTAITVKRFVKSSVAGVRRLFAISADGFLNLYEELYATDETAYETLTNNIASGVMDHQGVYIPAVTAGLPYSVFLPAGVTMDNGPQTLLVSGIFTALGNLVTFHGDPDALYLTLSLNRISWVVQDEDIVCDWTTRGYSGQSDLVRALRCHASLKTWNPKLRITALTDGIKEEIEIIAQFRRSNLKYARPFGKRDWDPSNFNDDHGTPFRQDYSVTLSDAVTASGGIQAGVRYWVESSDVTTACSINYNGVLYPNQTGFVGVTGVTTFTVISGTPLVYPPTSHIYLGANGVNFDLQQSTPVSFRIWQRGRYVQLRFQNTRGRAAVESLETDLKPADQREGVHV